MLLTGAASSLIVPMVSPAGVGKGTVMSALPPKSGHVRCN